jgi:hypothetical protein
MFVRKKGGGQKFNELETAGSIRKLLSSKLVKQSIPELGAQHPAGTL